MVSTIMMAMDSFPNHTELMTALCELLTRLITDGELEASETICFNKIIPLLVSI